MSTEREALLGRMTKEKLLEQRDVLAEAVEDVRGNLYLHGIGELDDSALIEAVHETVDCLPWFTHPGRRVN